LSKNKALPEIINLNKGINSALNNMAMNHTIVNVEETKENVGDPMEIKLFEFGNFYFSGENNDKAEVIMSFDSERGHKGAVFKRFDFDSSLFRMSSIGTSTVTQNDYYLYCKGSPELMVDIFTKESMPADYWDVLKQYTSQGFRVLSIGSRKVEQGALNSPRAELENHLAFEGFEVFENRLKP
jgi:cation-transporting ATPase 13A3/4/5